MSQIVRRSQSLEELPDDVTAPLLLTPRSRIACDIEGIDFQSLVYRPLEEFVDKQLSPRLVKLRYDFFEAKRKDMLVLAKAARVKVIEDRRYNFRETSTSASSEWGVLSIEREKLARFQAEERKWLQNCLNREITLLEALEKEDSRLTAESNDSVEKIAQESRRMKELNDRRRVIEEQKQRVREAQQEIEKEEAKVAFAKRQADLELVQQKLTEKKKKQHLKSVKDAEHRKQKEAAKRRAQDQVWAEKLEALSSMERSDLERLSILQSCKSNLSKKIHERMNLKEKRVFKSIEKHRQLENEKKSIVLAKLRADRDRDLRLAVSRSDLAEENAKKSLHLMVKRKIIQDESKRQLEVRRSDILAHQAEIDQRLAEHELKKNRYIAFKNELETLREQNKKMNVERQRKKFSFLRNSYAAKVAEKDAKVETIFSERQKLWDVRKKIAAKSQITRDHVKETIMNMRIKSRIDPGVVRSYVDSVLNPHDLEVSNDDSYEEVTESLPLPQMVQIRPEIVLHPCTPIDPPEPPSTDSEMSIPEEPVAKSPVRFIRAPEVEFDQIHGDDNVEINTRLKAIFLDKLDHTKDEQMDIIDDIHANAEDEDAIPNDTLPDFSSEYVSKTDEAQADSLKEFVHEAEPDALNESMPVSNESAPEASNELDTVLCKAEPDASKELEAVPNDSQGDGLNELDAVLREAEPDASNEINAVSNESALDASNKLAPVSNQVGPDASKELDSVPNEAESDASKELDFVPNEAEPDASKELDFVPNEAELAPVSNEVGSDLANELKPTAANEQDN